MSEEVETKGDSPRDRKISENSEPEVDVKFEPIVYLPEVEVPTHEENEEIMLKMRAKLYRFDTTNEEAPEWKERGTGEMKILRHKHKDSIRIVMRRDKTLKVCANHFITPLMELKPSHGCEKAFVYTVPADFADEILKPECLAIKFANVENAKLFKEKFNEARELMRTQEPKDSNDDKEEKKNTPENGEDVVTKKLSELEVSKDA